MILHRNKSTFTTMQVLPYHCNKAKMSLSDINSTSNNYGHLHIDMLVRIHCTNVLENKYMEFKV